MTDIPLIEQVEQARRAYLVACEAAATATKDYGDLRIQVGGNESERKAAAKRMPAEQYDGLLLQLAAADVAKTAAVAERDMREKDLNTLRDMLNYEAETIGRATAELQLEVAQVHRATFELSLSISNGEAKRTAAILEPIAATVDDSNLPY